MKKALHLMLVAAALLLPLRMQAQVASFPYAPDFSVDLGGWTAIDADGDGYNWYYDQQTNGVTAASYDNSYGALEPDNWLVSPAITLGDEFYTFTWYDMTYDADYAEEHYAVYISTTGATVDDFLGGEQIYEYTFTSSDNAWNEVSSDLSAYAGQTIWIAFRHWDVTDMWQMGIRGINIESADCPSITGFALLGYNSGGNPVFGWDTIAALESFYVYFDGVALGSTADYAVAISNIEPGSQHSVYIKSYCSNGDSTVSNTVTFTMPSGTMCTITVTAVDSYGDGWNDASLAIVQNGTQIGTLTVPNDGGNGHGGVAHEFSFDVDGGLPVEFVWTRGSYDGECSFTVTDGGGAVVYTCAQGDASNYSNGQTVFTLSGACPSCLVPQGFAVSDVTATTALITWTAEDVLGYQLAIGDNVYDLSGSSYNLSSLEPGEVYTLGLRKVCAEGDTSGWTAINFATPCEDLALPYSENFESGTAACWLSVGGNAGSMGDEDTNYYMSIGTSAIAVLNRPVQMPAMGLRVGYSLRDYGTVYYGYMTDPADASTFVQVGSKYGNSSGWNDYDYTIEGVDEGTVVYVALRNGLSYSTLPIDNIDIREFTGCKTPENVWINSVSDTEVEIQFVGVGAVGYELALSTSGSYVDSQTVVIETTDSVIVVTGLSPNTAYYNRMRSICNGYTTGWTSSSYFYTQRSWPEVVGIYQNTIGYENASLYWSWNSAINALESWIVRWCVAGTDEWSEASVDANTTSYTLDGLEQGVEYEFGVIPVSGGEPRTGLATSFTTLSCSTRNSGTSTNSNVFTNVNYRNTFSEQIVTADDLQGLGSTLSGITFYGNSDAQDTVRTLDLYLGHTAETAFGSTTAWVPVSELTLVAQNVSFTAGGTVHIDFDAPFVRSTDSNLVVAVHDHSGFYHGTFYWAGMSTEDYRTLYYRTDNESISLGSLPTGSRATFVCQMTFSADECELPDNCEQPAINVVQNGQGYDITVSPVQPNIAYTVSYHPSYSYSTDWIPIVDSLTSGVFHLDAQLGEDLYEFKAYRVCNGDTLTASYTNWYSNCYAPAINAWIDSLNNYVVSLSSSEDVMCTLYYIVYNNATNQNDTIMVGQCAGNDTVTIPLRSNNYVMFLVSRPCTIGEVTNSTYWIGSNCNAPAVAAWIDQSTYNYVVTWSGDATMEYTVSYTVYNNATGQYDTVWLGQYMGSDTVMFDFRSVDWISFIVSCECDNNTVFSSYWVSGNCQNPELSVNTNSSRVQLVVNNYAEGDSYNVYYRRAWYGEEYTLLAEGVQQNTYEVSGLAQDTYWEFYVTRMCGDSEMAGYAYSYGDCGTPNLWVNENNYIQWENEAGNEYEISYYDGNVGDYVYLTTTTDSVFNPAEFAADRNYDFRFGRSCNGTMNYNYISASGNCAAPVALSYGATDSSITIVWDNTEGFETTVRWGLRSGNYVQLGSATVEAGADSYTISGLESGGTYRIFLGRMCMDEMVESDGYNLNTNCAAPKAVPYFENFDDKERNYYVYDPCWWRGSTGTDYAPYYAIFSGNESDILLHVMNGSWVAMPVMDRPINELQVRFRYVAGGEDAEMILGLIGDADTSFDQLLVLDTIHHGDYGTEQSVWVTYRFDEVTDLTKNRIVFWGFQTEGYYSNLGEVMVEVIPPCAEVGGLACTGTTTDGATLAWDAAEGTFVEYIIEYGIKGFEPGTGIQVTSATNSIVLSDLEPATTYDAYVMVNCGRQGISHESSVARFTTECVALSSIYENFYGYTVPGSTYYGFLPTCWNYELMDISEDAVFLPQIMSGNEQYGGKALVMSSQAVVALPELNRPLNEMMVSLNMPYRNEDVNARLVLGTVAHTGVGMAATFEPLDTIGGTGYYEYFLDQYTGNRNILAIKNINDEDNDVNPRAYVVVNEVTVTDMPTCFSIMNVTATATDAHTIVVDWEENHASQNYAVEYYDNYNGYWVDTIVSGHPVTFSGLQANTYYEYYIYTVCADGSWNGGNYTWTSTPESCPGLSNMYIDDVMPNSITFSWVSSGSTVLVEAWREGNVLELSEIVEGTSYTLTGLHSGSNYQLRVYNYCGDEVSNNYNSWWFDTPNNCDAPENFTAMVVTKDTLTFTWTGTATQWRIRSGGGSIDSTFSGNSFTIVNPIAGADYQMYLKAVCSELDESYEVYTSAIIPCDTIELTVDNSVFETFDNIGSWIPSCWSVAEYNDGGYGYINGSLNHSGNRSMVMGSQSGSVGDMTIVTKAFTADTNIALEFWYSGMYYPSTFVVGYDLTDSLGNVERIYTDTLTSLVGDWSVYSAILPANATRVAFRYFDSYADGQTRYLGIDDVSLSVLAPATCGAPVAMNLDEVTATSITISLSGDTATESTTYMVRLTTVDGVELTATTDSGSISFTGLTPATTYAISARTLCSDINSPWVQFGEVQTSCELISDLPHFFDLSEVESHTLPVCWDYDFSSMSENHGWYPMHITDYRANNGLRVVGNMTVVLPEVSYDLEGLMLTFNLSGENNTGTFEIGYVENTEPGFDSTFTALASFDHNAGEVRVVFGESIAGHRRIAVRHLFGNSGVYSSAYITDIVLQQAPSCFAPDSMQVVAVTENSVTLDWTDAMPAQMWRVVNLDNDEQQIVTEHPVTIDGLSASTSYNFEVSTYCDGEWLSNYIYVTTACPAIATLPYSTDFSDVDFNCWAYDPLSISDNGGMTPQIYNLNDGQYNSTLLIVGNAVVALPNITADLTGYALTMEILQGNGDAINSIELGTVSNTADGFGQTFVPIDTISQLNSTLTFALDEYAGQGLRIAIRQSVPQGSFAYAFFDNLSIDLAPTCYAPENLTVTEVTENSVTLDWTNQGEPTEWVVEYYDRVNWNSHSVVANSHPFTVSDLEPGVGYEFYVSARCADEQTGSSYTYATTACGALVGLPINIDFEAGTTCWTFDNADSYWGNSREIIIYSNGSATSPAIVTGAEQVIVEFDAEPQWNGNNNNTYSFTVGTVGGTAQSFTFSGETTHFSLSLSMADTDHLVFTNVDYNSEFTIDNIYIHIAPDCDAPANLAATEVTSTSITLDWEGTAAEWELAYMTATGTNVQTVTVSAHPYTISNLRPGTDFAFNLRAVCPNGEKTAWVNAYASTACDVIVNLPFTYDFDSDAQGTMPACWAYDPQGTELNADNTIAGVPQVNYYSSANGSVLNLDYTTIVALPEMAAPINTLTVDFNVIEVGGSSAEAMLIAGVVESAEAGFVETFVGIDTLHFTDNDIVGHHSFDFANYGADGNRVAFRTVTPTTEWHYLSIDSVSINTTMAPCVAPDDVMLVSADIDEAEIDWTPSGDETAWEVLVENENTYLTFTATEHPFTVTGLERNTFYNVSVRALCTDAHVPGLWSESMGFYTIYCNPGMPQNVTVSDVTVSGATVSWTPANTTDSVWAVKLTIIAAPDEVAAYYGYDQDKIANGEYYGIWYTDMTSFVIDEWNVKPGCSYTVSVATLCDYNGYGSALTEPVSFMMPTCPDITDITVGAVSASDATITWTDNFGDANRNVVVLRDGSDIYNWDNDDLVAELTVSEASVTITGLEPSTTYVMYVSAECTQSYYVMSDAYSFTTLRQRHTAAAAVNDPAMGTATVSDTLPWHGDEVVFSANPAEGYHLVCWSNGETDENITVTIDGDITLTAFYALNIYSVQVGFDAATGSVVSLVGNVANGATYSVAHGDSIVLSAIAATGYRFVGWTDGTTTFATADITYGPSANVVLTANFVELGKVFVSTNVTGNGTVTGAGEYNVGDEVSLEATAAEGSHFVGWLTAEGNVTTATYTFTAAEDVTVTAVFAADSFNVVVNANALMGSVTGAGQYAYGATATLSATANEGYHFTAWSDGNSAATRVVNVYADMTFEVLFDTNVYNLTVNYNSTMGTVDAPATVKHFTSATLTATAAEGYHFTGWADQFGTVLGTDATLALSATSDTTVSALFARNQYTFAVGVNDEAMGTATVSDTTPYYGDVVTFVATAAEGYHFTGWSNGDTTATLYVVATANTSLTATFAINQYAVSVGYDETMGTVSGIQTLVDHGTTLTLTATAAEGYHFTGWSNGDTAATISLVVTVPVSLTATFAINQYIVSVVYNPTMGSVTNMQNGDSLTVNHGDSLTLTAVAAEGYRFVNWTIGSEVYATETVSFVVTANLTATANFASEDVAVLTLVANDTAMGTVSGAGEYEPGTVVTATATAAEHHHFIGWSNGSTEATISITMDSDITLTAYFGIDTHTVSVTYDAARGTVTGAGQYAYGTEATLTATAAEGYHFAGWSTGDTTATITVTVTADQTLTASFASDTPEPTAFTVSVNVNDPTMGIAIGGGTFAEGAECILTAVAYPGYRFVEWRNGDQTVSTDSVFTFSVSASITLTAIFEQVTGIDDVDASDVTIYSTDSKIVVRGAEGLDVRVYDVNGRLVCTEVRAAETCELRMSATGVYLVKVGDLPAKRVLVVR